MNGWFKNGKKFQALKVIMDFTSPLFHSTGAVSLAGAQANLWAVEGGNKLVCLGLLKLAKANLMQTQVTTISRQTTG